MERQQISSNRFNAITYAIGRAMDANNYSAASREAVLAALPITERRAYESMAAAMDRKDARNSDTRGTY